MKEVNTENYYTLEMNLLYNSVSQFKSFKKCEAETMAELREIYKPPESRAYLVGRYMDAKWSPDEMPELIAGHKADLYKKDGTPRADILAADIAYDRAYSDPVFRHYVADAEHQKIFVGEIAGTPWKCKLDAYHEHECIVDLKYMANIDPVWIDGEKKTFLEKYGYITQMAVYQELTYQNTDEKLPCYIAVITKETTPRIAIIKLPQFLLDSEMAVVEHYAPIYQEIKDGKREPTRCEVCDYCRSTYKVKPITYEKLLME